MWFIDPKCYMWPRSTVPQLVLEVFLGLDELLAMFTLLQSYPKFDPTEDSKVSLLGILLVSNC